MTVYRVLDHAKAFMAALRRAVQGRVMPRHPTPGHAALPPAALPTGALPTRALRCGALRCGARSDTRCGGGRMRPGAMRVVVGLLIGAAWAAPASATDPLALPDGGVVVGGAATITHPGPGQIRVDQGTERAVIDWRSFDVGRDASAHFAQPGSRAIAVNRVTGGADASQVLGRLSADGTVMVLNSNGVLIGATARIDVGGLVASTGDIDVDRFMAGHETMELSRFGDGSVVNQGTVTVADGGLAALVAPTVRNDGVIRAEAGRVALAGGGTAATVDLWGDGLVSFAVGDTGGSVGQAGRIEAAGGAVLLTVAEATRVIDGAIDMSGVVQVASARAEGGRITLDGGATGRVTLAGTLDAAGGTRGGAVDVTAGTVALAGAARIDASGAAGGGSVRIGGDYLGEGDLPAARTTTVAAGAGIRADATVAGDGGRVIVWADVTTVMDGAVSARGGPAGGDGGFVETSGKVNLGLSGSVDVSAPAGRAGAWLLDPRSVRIRNGSVAAAGVNDPPTGAGTYEISDTSIESALNAGADVTITTTGTNTAGATDAGNILVEDGIAWSGPGSLTLRADGDIRVLANMDSSWNGSAAGGNMTFDAGRGIHVGSTSNRRVATAAGAISLIARDGDILLQTTNFGNTRIESGSGAISFEARDAGSGQGSIRVLGRDGGSGRWSRVVTGGALSMVADRDLRIAAGNSPTGDAEAFIRSAGGQTIQVGGDLLLGKPTAAGGSNGSSYSSIESTGGIQSITVGGTLLIEAGQAGSSTANAVISSTGTGQSIQASEIRLRGTATAAPGDTPSEALIVATQGSQQISATGDIVLEARDGGADVIGTNTDPATYSVTAGRSIVINGQTISTTTVLPDGTVVVNVTSGIYAPAAPAAPAPSPAPSPAPAPPAAPAPSPAPPALTAPGPPAGGGDALPALPVGIQIADVTGPGFAPGFGNLPGVVLGTVPVDRLLAGLEPAAGGTGGGAAAGFAVTDAPSAAGALTAAGGTAFLDLQACGDLLPTIRPCFRPIGLDAAIDQYGSAGRPIDGAAGPGSPRTSGTDDQG